MSTAITRACVICGADNSHRKSHERTCGSPTCIEENRRNSKRAAEARRTRNTEGFVATDRYERCRALGELVRWTELEHEAEARGVEVIARKAREKAAELIQILGFDPLIHVPDRSVQTAGERNDALGRIISARAQAMLARIPGTTSDLADAAGIRASSVRSYLLTYLERGEIVCRTEGRVTFWELG
jgi:hypothetical protein